MDICIDIRPAFQPQGTYYIDIYRYLDPRYILASSYIIATSVQTYKWI